MSDTRHTIVLIDKRETVLVSWFRDAVSFGGLIGTAYALNVLMPPSAWLNAALAIAWFLWMLGKGSKLVNRLTFGELREWVRRHDDEPAA